MRTILKCYLIIVSFICTPFISHGQELAAKSEEAKKILAVANEMINQRGPCALITVDDQGIPRARAMDPFLPEKDFTIWFGTNASSRKVDQIGKNPNVTVYYEAENRSGYVTLHGQASLVNDPLEKARRWKTEWESFYPDREKDYLLIKVKPKWLEVISTTRNILGDDRAWTPPRILFEKY